MLVADKSGWFNFPAFDPRLAVRHVPRFPWLAPIRFIAANQQQEGDTA
jgi:hypothetical protein